MNNKRIPLEKEEPKHKKKSKKKGLPRANHKHQYETVLLHQYYHYKDLKNGRDKVDEIIFPSKVCIICGRIGPTDTDPSLYIEENTNTTSWLYYTKKLSEKALTLPKWYTHDYFDKFAYPEDPNDATAALEV